MKEVIAVIRMDKLGITRNALAEAGFCRLTAIKVKGRGKMLRELDLINQLPEEDRDIILESWLKGGRLIPKRMITILAQDEDVPRIVDIIIRVNKTGRRGDGKIFVLPVLDAVRIRTGETGEHAI